MNHMQSLKFENKVSGSYAEVSKFSLTYFYHEQSGKCCFGDVCLSPGQLWPLVTFYFLSWSSLSGTFIFIGDKLPELGCTAFLSLKIS